LDIRKSKYKCVQLEINYVASQCKEIYSNEKKSGKNIRSGICLFLGFRETEDNYKYVQLEITCVAGLVAPGELHHY
jgi:hypothetical protein